MKRLVDIVFTLAILPLALPLTAILALAVRLTSQGPALEWSVRIGRYNRLFRMPRLRTLRTDAPELVVRLPSERGRWLTPIGRFLTNTKLNELPQLWNVLKGEMSIVGPRPALHDQHDVIVERTVHGVHKAVPGVLDWAPLHGRGRLSICDLVQNDVWYMRNQSLRLDAKIILLAAVAVIRSVAASMKRTYFSSARKRRPVRS